MHDEHVLNHSSKHSSEIIQSKGKKGVNVNSTSNYVIIVHDTTPLASETMLNQDKQHEHIAHYPVGNSDRPLIEIIEPCEDITSTDPDKGLNKAQENFTLLKTPMEDQRSATPTTTHCNETMELGCEINNITNLTNGKSRALEANLTMQNISPLSIVRTTTIKIPPKVPVASSYPVLKNTQRRIPLQ